MDVILAFTCRPTEQPLCIPDEITELFKLPVIFGPVNRISILIVLSSLVIMAALYRTYRKPRLVPTKFGVAIEGIVNFVRRDIAVGIIGPGGEKYAPFLLSLFLFILVGNFFGITPFIMFPLGSSIVIPAFLALLTYVVFVFVGFKKQGLAYLGHTLWPPGVPILLKPLIGIIELVSIFVVRPFSLAIRLFANLVAGHTMLALLLGSGVFFVWAGATGVIGPVQAYVVGPLWFVLGMAIFTLELLILFLQAYIFTLLSAVYIESSLHPAH